MYRECCSHTHGEYMRNSAKSVTTFLIKYSICYTILSAGFELNSQSLFLITFHISS